MTCHAFAFNEAWKSLSIDLETRNATVSISTGKFSARRSWVANE
jgi:hypothetical protein